MPTENRSSNTEMVSDKLPPCADDVFKNGVSACLVGDVPKHAAETICQSLSAVTGWKIDWHYFGGRTHIKALAPAPQPHPEPIAWMVGTAFWWTKEEADRDAAATGLPIVGLGPITDPGEVKRLRGELVEWKDRCQRNNDDAMEWMAKHDTLRGQLTERDALLTHMAYYLSPALASHQYSMSEETMHHALSVLHDWRQLRASAEPSAPTRDPKLIGIVHTPPAEYDEP